MDTPPSNAGLLAANPARGLTATVCSVLAAVCLILFVPVIYLSVDLLAWHGRVSGDDPKAAVARWVSNEAAERVAAAPLSGHGILGTVSRTADHWTAPLVSALTSWNRWGWTNEGLLTELFGASVVLLLLRVFLLNAAAHLASGAAIEAAQKLRRDVYNHCYRMNSLATHPEQQAEAGEVITDKIERMQDGWIAARTTLARTLALALAAAVVLVLVNPWVGLAVLFLGGLVWLVAGQSAAWFRRDARHAERRAAARAADLRESLRLMLTVKCNLTERFSQNRVERQLGDLSKAARRRYRGEVFSRPTLFTVAVLTGVGLAYLAGRVVLGGGLSLAAAVVLAACGATLVLATGRWMGAFAQARRAKGAAADVAEFLDRRTDAAQPIDAEFLQPISTRLDLIEVSYREPGTGRMILEGVSMSVPAGSRAAVLCSDPAEARTLAYLLTRFLEPTAGEVKIDGKNVRWVTFESLRTQVGLVLPDHTTFADTVANNIGCGDTFTLPKIVDAAKAAHAHGFIQHLPYGYETALGDAGHALRPGERFRIALARVLLRDPAVLVLEEPAEPFDPDSAALIDDAIGRMASARTVIILARRASTVKRADRVFVIQDGKVVGGADHEAAATASQLARNYPARRSQSEAGST